MQVEARLSRSGVTIVNLGLIDTPDYAVHAGNCFRESGVDIIFLYVTTYAVSASVLPIVRRAKVPVIVLNLQPTSNIDYAYFNSLSDRTTMTGEWLAYCSACPVPEIANVFHRLGLEFHQVAGFLNDDPVCSKEIDSWVEAARVCVQLENNTLGLLGHYYSGMLDIYTDLTLLNGVFGGQIKVLEMDELSAIREGMDDRSVEDRLALFESIFDIQPDCKRDDLVDAAKSSLALDRLVEQYGIGSIAYYYKGTGNASNELTMSSIILGTSLLTASGVPVAGEYEVKNAIAMKILAALGVGGSFTEFYAIDFADDIVLMGHDGPGHVAIAEGKTKVRPLDVYHGKVGRGVSVEMSVRHGPVTLLSVAEDAGRGFKFVIAEGESVSGPILEIGNTNSRYRFSLGARRFVSEWSNAAPAHHCAIGLGHVAGTLEKLGALLKIPVIRVC